MTKFSVYHTSHQFISSEEFTFYFFDAEIGNVSSLFSQWWANLPDKYIGSLIADTSFLMWLDSVDDISTHGETVFHCAMIADAMFLEYVTVYSFGSVLFQ